MRGCWREEWARSMAGDVDEEKAGATLGGAQVLSSESTTCDFRCLSTQSLESYGMVLLMVVVAVAEDALAEDVLAVLTLRAEVSSGDENTGMNGDSCAEAAKGRNEGDP